MSKEGRKEVTAYFGKNTTNKAYGMDRILLLIKAICLALSPLSCLDSLLVDTECAVYVYFLEFLGIL